MSLTNVTIPSSVTNMGGNAFFFCTNLTSVILAQGITSIGGTAFNACYSLATIIIPNTVTNIGGAAFESCVNLTGVYFQGNAPSYGASVFFSDNNATNYYLAGATGWGPLFATRPTAVWVQPSQASCADPGVRTNQFGFNIIGSSNLVILVEACTNLANPIWSPIQTNTLAAGSSYFGDPQWTNYPIRFYRLRSP
jgi:hypothetical protein